MLPCEGNQGEDEKRVIEKFIFNFLDDYNNWKIET